MPVNSQFGFRAESAWGTPITPNRFLEFNSEGIELETDRIEIPTMRSSGRALRTDRSLPVVKGAGGQIELPLTSKGCGLLLQHAFGTVSVPSAVDSTYAMTFWPTDLYGLGLTCQVNRTLHPSGSNQAFTWSGGKVKGGELSCDKDGYVKLVVDLVFKSETLGTALASASYSSGVNEFFPWSTATCSVSGTSVPVESWKISWDNGLDVERFKLQNSAARQEPTSNGFVEVGFEFTADWSGTVQYDRVAATVAGSNTGTVTVSATAPTIAGTATYPSISGTIPAARFDEGSPAVSGMDSMLVTYSGKGLFDGTSQPLTVTYVTLDSAA